MPTFQTYTLIGAKEDISDIISNISPTKTPFLTAIGREKVTQKYFQWQEDSLRAVAANAQIEGGDPTDVTVDVTTMRNGYTQIFWESVKVAGTVDATSTYGRAKESAYQMSKSAAQVKRDLEQGILGQQVEKTPVGLRIDQDEKQPIFYRIIVENIGKARADNGPDTPGGQSPGSVFAR